MRVHDSLHEINRGHVNAVEACAQCVSVCVCEFNVFGDKAKSSFAACTLLPCACSLAIKFFAYMSMTSIHKFSRVGGTLIL